MFKVTLTFDSYEEVLRVKESCNQIMSGEDPYEHAIHGTPKNAVEILYDAIQEQIPEEV